MKRLYICHTNYHLLIAICHMYNVKSDIILFNKISNRDRLKSKLKNFFGIENVFLIDEENEKYSISNDYDIYIFNDWTSVGNFLRKNKRYYTLMEDGYNYYSYDLYRQKFSLRRRIFNFLFSDNIPLGYSKYANSIEVNDKSNVVKDRRYKKMLEVSRKEMFKNIDERRKKVILEVFDVKPMKYTKSKKSLLVLTQPLYQDKFDTNIINSNDDQVRFYSDIVNKYKRDYTIYVKVHPRDKTNYHSLDGDVIFLDKDVPMELYEFVGDYEFDLGITHSSTALDYLSCIKEKIFLKDLKAK